MLHEPVTHAHGGLECELLAVLHLGVGHAVVDLFEGEHAEGHVAGFVAHDVAQELFEQRLLGELVQEAECGEGEALDHDLHTEVRHVPAAVVDDVVEQHPQVGVHLVAAAELLVQVPTEDLDVASFVDDLRARVQLGVVPRHRLDDLRGADERALLTMEELAELPVTALDTEVEPLLVAPLRDRCADERVHVEPGAEDLLVQLHRLLDIDLGVPREIGAAVPLTDLGLLVQLAQRRPRERVVPREDRVGIVLDHVFDLVRVGRGDRQDGVDVVDLATTENGLVVVVDDGHEVTPVGVVIGWKAGRIWVRMKDAAEASSPRSTCSDGARK